MLKGLCVGSEGNIVGKSAHFSKDHHSLVTAIAAMERQSGILIVTLVRNDRTQPHTSRSFFWSKVTLLCEYTCLKMTLSLLYIVCIRDKGLILVFSCNEIN